MTGWALLELPLSRDHQITLESISSQCDLLKRYWRKVEQFCEPLPGTVVHGDFVGKNLGLRSGSSGIVLLPFDWENAGWGPPTIDIATAGLAQFAANSAPFSESSEISAYRSIVCSYWPQFAGHDTRVLAIIGMIFRLIDAVTWACAGLIGKRSTGAIVKSLGLFGFYQREMASTLQALTGRS